MEILSDCFLLGVTEHHLCRIIPEGDSASLIHHDDGVGRCRGDAAKLLLTIAQLLFGLLPLRNILSNADDAAN